MEVVKTDVRKIILYLEDAALLYDALAALPMQKCNCRSHMIRQLINKLNLKLSQQ